MLTQIRTKFCLTLSILLLVISAAPLCLAQIKTNEKSTAQTAPPVYSVTMMRIKPGMVTEWQEFRKTETLPALQKAGVKQQDVWASAVFGEAREYVVVTRIESMAQYDSPGPIVKALGEEGARAYSQKAARFIESSHTYAFQARPDLSLAPAANQMPKVALVSTVKVAPGRNLEFESLVKNDILPVMKKAELKGYLFSQTIIGGDVNEYHALALYDSFAELDKGAPTVRVLGQEGANKLLQKAAGIVTHLERATYRYVTDLSIRPQEMKAENK